MNGPSLCVQYLMVVFYSVSRGLLFALRQRQRQRQRFENRGMWRQRLEVCGGRGLRYTEWRQRFEVHRMDLTCACLCCLCCLTASLPHCSTAAACASSVLYCLTEHLTATSIMHIGAAELNTESMTKPMHNLKQNTNDTQDAVKSAECRVQSRVQSTEYRIQSTEYRV